MHSAISPRQACFPARILESSTVQEETSRSSVSQEKMNSAFLAGLDQQPYCFP